MAHIECGVVMGGNDSGFGIFIYLSADMEMCIRDRYSLCIYSLFSFQKGKSS